MAFMNVFACARSEEKKRFKAYFYNFFASFLRKVRQNKRDQFLNFFKKKGKYRHVGEMMSAFYLKLQL